MTHTTPPDDAPTSRPTATDNTRWTGAKAAAFLKLLARSGKVAPCAAQVGMSRQAAYRLRARAPEFAKYWHAAMEEARRRRAASRRRAKGRGKGRAVHPLLARRPVRAGNAPAVSNAVDAAFDAALNPELAARFVRDTLGRKG